jgi:hypothetical protein
LSGRNSDAAFFEIAGSALYLKAGTVLDYESKTSYAVAVTVDGQPFRWTAATGMVGLGFLPGVTGDNQDFALPTHVAAPAQVSFWHGVLVPACPL